MDAYFYNPRMGKTYKNITQNPEVIKEKIDTFDYIKSRVLYSKLQPLKNKREKLDLAKGLHWGLE